MVMASQFFNRSRAENSAERGGISQTPGASDADGPRPKLHAGSTSHGNGRARGARAKSKWEWVLAEIASSLFHVYNNLAEKATKATSPD